MVATKRVPLAEVDNGKERRWVNNEGGSDFQEPLGGFIFVCNNDTISEDFERNLFGLPQRYHDSVKSIQPGLPLFLYNYSTRCLHGVFEASSDGGLNIEPDAWGENKESRKNGRQSVSRFPAQVRVRWREECPPLEEEKFRPLLYHYDGPKFRLQLSKSEVHELLKLFGASPIRKVEDAQEDAGGEWEKVKTKSKASRNFRATLAKGSTSPNSNAGRRRGSLANGSTSNGGALFSIVNNPVHEVLNRGRESENKPDSAQRWRTDSDSWSGSSSAGTASSNSGSHDEDRSKRATCENGCIAEMSEAGSLEGAPGSDRGNRVPSSEDVSCINGSVDAHQSRIFETDSNDLNGFSSTNSVGGSVVSNSNSRPGFVSYRAALKSGMLGASAVENGFGENQVSSPRDNAMSPNNKLGNRISVNTYSSVASATSLSPSSPIGIMKGDLLGESIEGPKQKSEVGWTKVRSHIDRVASNHSRAGPVFALENGNEEHKADHLENRDGDDKRAERIQPWGKPSTSQPVSSEVLEMLYPKPSPSSSGGSGQSNTVAEDRKSILKSAGDLPSLSKKLAKDGFRNVLSEGETGASSAGNHSHGNSELKGAPGKPLETTVRKNAWQSSDGAVLRLLHDPDPAVNSTSDNGQKMAEVEGTKKQEKGQRLGVQTSEEKAASSQALPSDILKMLYPKQLPSSSGGLLPHGSHPKAPSQDSSFFQQSRTSHEPRRQQFDGQKHEKQQEDRAHFRKQQLHPQGHPQHASSMLHTQQHQAGQGLMPLRVPTPPPLGMQQHHHQPLLSPAPQAPLYRDRSRSRAGNGSVENVHGLAYRPVSRNMLDGEVAMQSPVVAGSWGLQSPVLILQQMPSPVASNVIFLTPPPGLLMNAEILHAEILEFAQAKTPSAETRLHAEAAVECVRSSVKQLWPEADVEVFGSFATGLCLHHSDVDVVVVDAPLPQDSPGIAALSGARLLTPLIRDLAAALKEHEWCEGLNTIETASMPVIKLRCSPITAEPSPGLSVAIDITIGGKRSATFAGVSQVGSQKEATGSKPLNPRIEAARNAHNGAAAREFVIERLRQLPALAPLVLLLKSFLRRRNLNDVYSGGLGSFALTLMLVFYLERVQISCGTPQEIARSSKSPPVNMEASTLSVDTSQASLSTAESVDFSDDDSSDSSVLTSTSASTEVASLQGSLCGGDSVSTAWSLSNEEPVLRKAGSIVEELLASMHSVASPNLGTLLVGFLCVFGRQGIDLSGYQGIDLSGYRLVLKGRNGNPGGLFLHEENARTLPLCIDDPLRPDAYIGAGSFNIWQVQAALFQMLKVITMPQSAASNPLSDGERAGNVFGQKRNFPLLQSVFGELPPALT